MFSLYVPDHFEVIVEKVVDRGDRALDVQCGESARAAEEL
jgi:hypothetical protein